MARLFGKLGFGAGKKTFKPVKGHKGGSKAEELHQYTRRTLGSGNMRLAVQLPPSEALNEWLSVNSEFVEISYPRGVLCVPRRHAPTLFARRTLTTT